jgi:D-beta-D-heptose 7-phosphate kinase/D-beta-D-heptose 1-phosphate adenosyltransferase
VKTKIPDFGNINILVVGDVMLDRYWWGDVSRISPEAPVPIVHIGTVDDRLGGAGNVALNIKALGGQVTLLGLVGNDSFATTIEKISEERGIDSCLLRVNNSPTINKLRVLGQGQQLIRLDFEQSFETWQEEDFFHAYKNKLDNSNLVILSDYNKGTLRQSRQLIAEARRLNKTVLVDPKGRDFSIYRGATIITPNLMEFETIVGHCQGEQDLENRAKTLLDQHDFQAILITRGAQGMSLISRETTIHLPTDAKEVYDVTGAGDTVIATLGAAIAAGDSWHDAMILANLAAGEVIKKVGASAISPMELSHAVSKRQNSRIGILDEELLLMQIKEAVAKGEKIVMTNGCFDIIHPGHVIYLEKAKSLGDRLVVAVNDDASVARIKGKQRPINKLRDRMLVLSALATVDWVISFTEDTPERLVKLINPSILAKGGDYKVDEIAGAQHVLNHGGTVSIIPFEEGFSTTNIIQKINV